MIKLEEFEITKMRFHKEFISMRKQLNNYEGMNRGDFTQSQRTLPTVGLTPGTKSTAKKEPKQLTKSGQKTRDQQFYSNVDNVRELE